MNEICPACKHPDHTNRDCPECDECGYGHATLAGAKAWEESRPDAIKEAMKLFPPGSIVKCEGYYSGAEILAYNEMDDGSCPSGIIQIPRYGSDGKEQPHSEFKGGKSQWRVLWSNLEIEN